MSLETRLRRLEAAARLHGGSELDEPADDRAWLVRFRQWAEQGLFGHAPDFPTALADYQAAIEQAEAQTDPPFDPPDSFQPGLPRGSLLLVENWRSSRFPALWTAWLRVADLMEGYRQCPSTTA